MNCQHVGCNRTLVVDCIRPELVKAAEKIDSLDKNVWRRLQQEYIEYFCPQHCRQYGYCWSCGFYQQNLTEVDESGLCKFCKIEL